MVVVVNTSVVAVGVYVVCKAATVERPPAKGRLMTVAKKWPFATFFCDVDSGLPLDQKRPEAGYIKHALAARRNRMQMQLPEFRICSQTDREIQIKRTWEGDSCYSDAVVPDR